MFLRCVNQRNHLEHLVLKFCNYLGHLVAYLLLETRPTQFLQKKSQPAKHCQWTQKWEDHEAAEDCRDLEERGANEVPHTRGNSSQ